MRRTLSSLAILKVNWDRFQKDYIENFVPLALNIIKTRGYDEIHTDGICKDFADEYGFIVPYHPMMEILNRIRKEGFIEQRNFKYYPVKRKYEEFDLQPTIKRQAAKLESLLEAFSNYAVNKYGVPFSVNEAEIALIDYLKRHDLDILFVSEQSSLLPTYPERRDAKFLVSKFVEHIHDENPEMFGYIVDISIGHILANTVTFSEKSGLEGSLEKAKIYLDTTIVFRLLGYDTIPWQESYIELLDALREAGARVYIFEHTFREIEVILTNCRDWLTTGNYDLSKANPALRYFVHSELTASDVDRIIINLRSTLEKHGINVVERPTPFEHRDYQIDEKALGDYIIEAYKGFDARFNEQERKNTILRDIDSISAIYYLRKDKVPLTIKDCEHIFVTTNASLAFSAKRAESEQIRGFSMPACMTDVFLGTLLWIQAPAKLVDVNSKKLITNCLAALHPSEDLLKKYFRQIEKLEREKTITSDEYYLLRTYHVSLKLLEEKTMGDPNRFSEKTVDEILDEIHGRAQLEAAGKLSQEQEEHELTRLKLQQSEAEKKDMELTLIETVNKLAGITGNAIFITILVVCLSSIIYTSLRSFDVIGGNVILLWITGVIAVLTAIAGLAFKLDLWGLREIIVDNIAEHLLDTLRKRQNQQAEENASAE